MNNTNYAHDYMEADANLDVAKQTLKRALEHVERLKLELDSLEKTILMSLTLQEQEK